MLRERAMVLEFGGEGWEPHVGWVFRLYVVDVNFGGL